MLWIRCGLVTCSFTASNPRWVDGTLVKTQVDIVGYGERSRGSLGYFAANVFFCRRGFFGAGNTAFGMQSRAGLAKVLERLVVWDGVQPDQS
ncbi:MAG: hypothetical protein JWO68_4288 [Actinomycetia bacterium]|nr:hypothetical protein [Actinomycetes bacterium]